MPPFEPQGGIAHREPWENYMAELARIADENPYVAFYDMSARVEVNPDTYGVLLDGTHTTAKGSALLANLVREALTPA
jgi:lysophospholipase L1-like esterase